MTAIAVQIQLPDNFSEVVAIKIAEASQRVAEGNRYVSLTEAARIINTTRSSLRNLAELRMIPYYPGKGKDLEFRVSDLWAHKDKERKDAKF
ncbi:MAG TPA: hypothetical protein VNQ90_04785 [Chthoniobacteraceae bacterium]|nr:hypothetical protein [Chthoniobacteraceae bacterium]